jgi:hypothetical protein
MDREEIDAARVEALVDTLRVALPKLVVEALDALKVALSKLDRTAWLTMQSDCEPFSAPCAIYRTRAPMDALGQLGVEHDLGLENLGDWAVLLGVSRQIGEFCFVEVGHFGVQRQS